MIHDEILEHFEFMSDQSIRTGRMNEGNRRVIEMLKEMKDPPLNVFYFDDIGRDQELIETAEEWFASGLLQLPFDNCLLISKKLSIDGLSFGLPEGDEFCLWARKVSEGVRYTGIVLYQGHTWPGPLYIPMFETTVKINTENCNYELSNNIFSFTKNVPDNYDKKVGTVAQDSLIVLFLMLMSLNMPSHYEQDPVQIGEKLNKARRKRGRPELKPYTIVRLNRQIHRALGDGAGGWKQKPHWRRGHIRRLQNGKLIPIAPYMVNWSDHHPETKTYLVKSNTGDHKTSSNEQETT